MNPLTPWVLCCQLVGVSFFLTGILELTVLAVLALYPLLWQMWACFGEQ